MTTITTYPQPSPNNNLYLFYTTPAALFLLSLILLEYPQIHSLYHIVVLSLLCVSPLLLHEIGHWAIMHRLHIPLTSISLGLGPTLFTLPTHTPIHINLLPIGAAITPNPIQWTSTPNPLKLLSTLSGPIFNIFAAFGLFVLNSYFPHALCSLLFKLHLYIGLFNLLPIPPLDGYLAISHLYHIYNPHKPFSQSNLHYTLVYLSITACSIFAAVSLIPFFL